MKEKSQYYKFLEERDKDWLISRLLNSMRNEACYSNFIDLLKMEPEFDEFFEEWEVKNRTRFSAYGNPDDS